MKWLLPARVTIGFAAAILSAVTGGAICLRALAAQSAQAALMEHATESHASLHYLLSVVRDAETDQRGYLLTGDDRTLRSYSAAVAEIGPTLDQVRELMQDSRDQLRSLEALASLVHQETNELTQAIEIRREQGLEAALKFLAGDRGADLLEQVRGQLEDLEQVEQKQLAEREAAWHRSIVISNLVLAFSALVLLVLIAMVAKLVWEDTRDREERAAERQRMLEVQQQLMGVVSHDLRNPLSAIMLIAKLLPKVSELTQKQKTMTARILSSARRMERMIRDLLDYTRARVGMGIPISPRPTDLAETCSRVIDELEGENPRRRVHCRHEGLSTGEWDPDRLEQVLSNLLSNALHYSPKDTPVELVTVSEGEKIRIRVHNEGEPIPPDVLPHIFEPFKRSSQHASGSLDGLGLGLFIVRHIVEAHGGQIEVRSEAGEGTTFKVRLPHGAAARFSHGAPPA